jgi:hypothetical protein
MCFTNAIGPKVNESGHFGGGADQSVDDKSRDLNPRLRRERKMA